MINYLLINKKIPKIQRTDELKMTDISREYLTKKYIICYNLIRVRGICFIDVIRTYEYNQIMGY